jgi:hypothetical protein
VTQAIRTLLFGALLLAFPLAAKAQDDPDEEDSGDLEDLDGPTAPVSPRTGTICSVSLPLGYAGGSAGGGVAYGISGELGGGPISVPLYLVLANGGHSGGQYMIGVRYSAPKLAYVEALAGWVKASGYEGATLGVGAGGGVDIPVYHHFTITVGGTLSYAIAQHGVFGMVWAGPTLHI